jgi:hypothetical protein
MLAAAARIDARRAVGFAPKSTQGDAGRVEQGWA